MMLVLEMVPVSKILTRYVIIVLILIVPFVPQQVFGTLFHDHFVF